MIIHLSHAANSSDGGIATAVQSLSAAQHSIGLNSTWLTADRFEPRQRDRAISRAVLAASPQLVHLHGLWRSPTRVASRTAGLPLPLVIAPHGMLDSGALAISRYKKQLVWHLWEKRALESSRCLHALCSAEAAAIRVLLPRVPIAVIPNGVELPNASDAVAKCLPPWDGVIPAGESVMLFLGRFHPKKGLDPLLKAWQAVIPAAKRHRYWLALVGYGDDGALARRVAEAQQRGELERLHVFGPVFRAQKAAALSAATTFVLPSFSEGLPMAALEAMAYQRPCILTEACNLPEAFQVGAALRAESSPSDLAAVLERCFKLSSTELAAMGHAGQSLVRISFSWSQAAADTHELYSWVLGGGERPSFVRN
ncbi:glycosyltransferase [Synechococcus sp. WH 8016]|uniref:glycosyltransferase n=1 Tax=Synechococcus sp. WH 8016 TaxID=166318 RepID=UPI00131F3FEC|nr:glycosyltransferase [Synechococcus sp. WH 8016]